MSNSEYKNPTPPKPLFKDFKSESGLATYSDPSNLLGSDRGYYIQFEYIHGNPEIRYVSFKAFLTGYTDSFSSNWNSEEVYGRGDPIYTFQGTKRSISIAWAVPASSVPEAKQNLARASKMMRFLYPSYTRDGDATTITKPPLLRMKFTNLIKRDSTQGLLGKLNGLEFAPDLDAGWFEEPGVSDLYPKLLTFNAQFDVIHEHHLGWHDCSGFWERTCIRETGTDSPIPDKMSWPYMPAGLSANVVHEIPDFNREIIVENESQDEQTDSEPQPEEAKTPSSDSPAAAQGVTKSEEQKKRENTDPTGRNRERRTNRKSRKERNARNRSNLGG